MTLLYLTPTYNSASEVWQQRHLKMLKEHVFCIATNTANENKWNHQIPIVKLNPEMKLSTKIRKQLKLKNINKKTINKKVTKLIKKSDCVFVQYLNHAVKLSDALNNTDRPVFVHTHGFDVTWDFRYHSDPDKKVHASNYVESVLKLKNHISFIANSIDTKSKLMSIGIDEKRIHLKYLGTDIYEERKQNNEKSSDFNLLYLGRLVDFKGPDLVIEAFEKACEMGLQGNLIMAGDGPLRAACELMKGKSKFSEHIQMLGAVSKEKGDELRKSATVFIAHNCKGPLSRQEEAFGVSVIEAMEAQIPVITGASAGINETVVHNETGLLNEPFDVEQQAKNIMTLYNNSELAKKMGKAGRERVIAHFSYEAERENFLRILNSGKSH
ncbi:MAG: glycosyltransferase family 4 protein [Aquaticitalea sp.]